MKIQSMVFLSLIAGCASTTPLSREEWLAMTRRDFAVDEERLLRESERIFRLMDGENYHLAHNDAGFQATRGGEIWTITASRIEGGARLQAQASFPSLGFNDLGSHLPVESPAIYTLFWNRLDYLLGKTDHWITCPEAQNWDFSNEPTKRGGVFAICRFGSDKHPQPERDDRAQYDIKN